MFKRINLIRLKSRLKASMRNGLCLIASLKPEMAQEKRASPVLVSEQGRLMEVCRLLNGLNLMLEGMGSHCVHRSS